MTSPRTNLPSVLPAVAIVASLAVVVVIGLMFRAHARSHANRPLNNETLIAMRAAIADAPTPEAREDATQAMRSTFSRAWPMRAA